MLYLERQELLKDYTLLEPVCLDSITKTVRIAFHPLKQIRMSKGFTLSALAKSAGVYRWTIHFIEIMRVKPKPKTMYKLGVALGVNPAELYVSVLEYGMETIKSEHAKTLRIVAKPGETPKQMIARLVHRQLHPFFRNLNKQKMSAAKFLEEVDISKATIKNWIDGKCVPNTSTLSKLCEAFNVSMDDLLTEMKEWNAEDTSDPVLYIEQNIHRLEE